MWEGKFRVRYADVAATLALVLAGGGTAYTATALPKNSVGSPQIQTSAVTGPKVHAGAVTGPKLKRDAVTSAKVLDAGITRADLADGAVGTTQIADGSISTVKIGGGQITEGHLATGAVRSAAVLDESLSVTDIAGSQANYNLAAFTLQADECALFSLGAPGAAPGQLAVAGWLVAPPEGIVADVARVTSTNGVGFRMCNLGSTQVTYPGGNQVLRVITLG